MESISKIETFDSLSFELENKLQNEGEYVDALRVKLTIKASHDISNAYLVALAHFTTPRDSIIKQRPFRKVLGDFKAKETRIFALQFFGFPQAFQMEAFELHLYSNGVKIPHQASPGLLVMTDQETFEYLLSKYKESGGRPEPTLFKPLQGQAVKALLPNQELSKVKVDFVVRKDGTTTVDFLNIGNDSAASNLVSYLEQIRFFPAMKDGDLIESMIYVPLASIVGTDG